jgi:hypothetical protein
MPSNTKSAFGTVEGKEIDLEVLTNGKGLVMKGPISTIYCVVIRSSTAGFTSTVMSLYSSSSPPV